MQGRTVAVGLAARVGGLPGLQRAYALACHKGAQQPLAAKGGAQLYGAPPGRAFARGASRRVAAKYLALSAVQQLQGGGAGALQCCVRLKRQRLCVSRTNTNLPELRQQRRVRCGRWTGSQRIVDHRHKPVCGKWSAGRTTGVKAAWLSGSLAMPVLKRRHQKPVLQGVDGGHVVWAIHQHTPDDPVPVGCAAHVAAWCTELGRHLARPARPADQHLAGTIAGGAGTYMGKGVGVVVQETQHVVAVTRVGHRDHERPLRQVDPGVDVQRVVVGHYHAALAGGEQLALVCEQVAPALGTLGAVARKTQAGGLARRGGGPHALHLEQRPAVNAGLQGQRVQVVGARGGGGGGGVGVGHGLAIPVQVLTARRGGMRQLRASGRGQYMRSTR